MQTDTRSNRVDRLACPGVAQVLRLRRIPVVTAMLTAIAALLTGCAGGFRDYADPTGKPSDRWITEAGVEARAGQRRETSNDPLNLRSIFMSEKARDIERNCGVD